MEGKIEMDAVKFIKERNRLCDMYLWCSDCPARDKDRGCKLSITSEEEAEKQIELLEKWYDEHPEKTQQDVFLEQHQRAHGHWVHLGWDEWCCSSCGFVITTEGSWDKPTKKYCEDCGAKMDG